MSSPLQNVVIDSQGVPALSRRRAIQVAAAAAGCAAIAWPDREARANPALFIAGTVFPTVVAWFVNRLLNRLFPDDPQVLEVRYVPYPQPSPDAFHNRFAAPFMIYNRRYYLPSAYSDRGAAVSSNSILHIEQIFIGRHPLLPERANTPSAAWPSPPCRSHSRAGILQYRSHGAHTGPYRRCSFWQPS